MAVGGTILGILGIIVGIAFAIPTGGASLSLAAVGFGAVATVAGAAAIGTGIASFVYSAQGNEESADLLGKISLGLGAFPLVWLLLELPGLQPLHCFPSVEEPSFWQ